MAQGAHQGSDASGDNGLIAAFQFLGVIPDRNKIAKAAAKMRKANRNKSPGELARALANGATWRMTGAGVVASLPGAVPGLGTAVQIGVEASTLSAETWLMLRNLATLQMMVAALYGHDVLDDHRLDELVVIWGLTTGAIIPAKDATKRVGTKIAVKQFNLRVSGEALRRINKRLGTTVLTKWGTKRGGIALGRLIPFGVGALVGGGMNYATARGFASKILVYYDEILPSNEYIIITES